MTDEIDKHAKPTGKVRFIEDGTRPALRMHDLIRFLGDSRRSLACPHCPHVGQWEVSMVDEEGSQNPPLVVYELKEGIRVGETCVGMTCPNCGHFAMISTYKIREFLQGRG